MAMTKLLSQKLKKSENKDLLLSEIGRVEQMLLDTINIVRSYDFSDEAPVDKMISNAQEVQVLLDKTKEILHKVTANGGEKVKNSPKNSPIYFSILNLLCPCVRCHDV